MGFSESVAGDQKEVRDAEDIAGDIESEFKEAIADDAGLDGGSNRLHGLEWS